MPTNGSDRSVMEGLLARPVTDASRAAWGFTNRTDMVTLESGERVVVQRYGRRDDAEHRLRIMRALQAPAAAAGIAIPHVREADLDAGWVMFDLLPGVVVPADGAARPGALGFPAMARAMGELLARFRALPVEGLDDLWACPERLVGAARRWAVAFPETARTIDEVPDLFAGRPVVLAHGDFAPVNVLIEDNEITGLLDFESVRSADPLFDVAWWAWSVSFAGAAALAAGWRPFLEGAGIDPAEPDLDRRVRALQILRMLELLAAGTLSSGIASVVENRLRETAAA
jgi:aminoglycoside phosphotransferase (APT) family kinase protein